MEKRIIIQYQQDKPLKIDFSTITTPTVQQTLLTALSCLGDYGDVKNMDGFQSSPTLSILNALPTQTKQDLLMVADVLLSGGSHSCEKPGID